MFGRLRCYLRKSNLHGLRYIAEENTHWCIRLFWILVFLLHFATMQWFFRTAYKAYQEDAIRFLTETTYLEWNTTFPAVTICPIKGNDLEWDYGDITEEEDIYQQKLFISDLAYYTGSCYSCGAECEACSKMNFTEIARKYRNPCDKILGECSWYNKKFDCCKKFLPLETEYGICYSFSSLHTTPSEIMKMNRSTGPGKLWIKAFEDVRLFFHAPEDVPFINTDPDQRADIMLGDFFNISIKVIEISNEDEIKNLNAEKRGCKFPWETEGLLVHKHYSYSTCVVECHAENHIRLCNCTHHLMPYYNKIKYCDVQGLQCLTDYFDVVNRLNAKGFEKQGLVCDCVPSCFEPEYNVVSLTKGLSAMHSEISVEIQSLPTTRFRRIVLRSDLDLVVSIGGTAGLFIGASLLSIVELVYLWFFGDRD